jgi:hypothetical protein
VVVGGGLGEGSVWFGLAPQDPKSKSVVVRESERKRAGPPEKARKERREVELMEAWINIGPFLATASVTVQL